MTPDQREWLERYLAELACALDLDPWRITVRTDPPTADYGDPDDPPLASIDPTYGRRVASLRVVEDFFDLTPAVQRETLLHELLHLYMHPASEVIRCGVGKWIGQAAYEVLLEAFKQQIEYGVDGIAVAIAERFPLPPPLSATPDTVGASSSTTGGEDGHGQAEGGGTEEPEEGPRQAVRPETLGQAS
jgi:hypothetical protein